MQYKIILIIILIIINYFFYKKYNENFDVSISTPLSQLTISPSSVNNFLSNVQIILQKIQKRNLQNAQ